MKRPKPMFQPELWDEVPEAFQPEDSLDGIERGLAGFERIDWSFRQSTERGLTHGLHPWPAKFIPDIPATAIALLSKPGDTILDPFCGCGTTAVEAIWADRGFIVADVNALAVRISQGKCEVPSPKQRRAMLEWSLNLGVQEPTEELLALAPPIPNLSYWFDEPVVAQLAYLLREIRSLAVCTQFLETVFSSIVVGVSHQESETRYRRVERVVTAEEVLARFRRRLHIGLGMAATLDSCGRNGHSRQYLVCDAKQLIQHLPEACAQLAVFSPPYPNSFDYHLYHRFRMFWLGMDPRPVKHLEIGAHLRYQPDEAIWLADMETALAEISRCLAPGSYAVCVVGSGLVRGRMIPSGDLLWELAPGCGLQPAWRATREVARHRKSFNLSDSRLNQEDIMVFQR